ncbi:hypothetical protein [Tardiphaga sp. 709]|uniref:hypothetical protein n=1 Tax=Tardiphaga sp. 709 TaxID=3076039 RepID=UPI0028EBED4F|nr:hypothetical protein [Tardiphaga sp. 709]WNV09962.1 hypothetical protein RSO67_01835 [Tardiphaga sp. 709]
MTLLVPKSMIGDSDFAAMVETHRQNMTDHTLTVGIPQPTAPILVEQAVIRVPQGDGLPDLFVADFEIVDDTPPPTPEPTLEERRAVEIMKSRQQEQADIASIMPAGRLRLFQMDVNAAMVVPEADRSPQQIELMQRWAEYQDQVRQVQYEGAKREAAIEDMT